MSDESQPDNVKVKLAMTPAIKQPPSESVPAPPRLNQEAPVQRSTNVNNNQEPAQTTNQTETITNFGWLQIEKGPLIPFIKRKTECFVACRIVVEKVFLNIKSVFTEEMIKCITWDVKLMTKSEADTFNDLNINHCDKNIVGEHIFKPGDNMVTVEAVEMFVQYFYACRYSLFGKKALNHLFGFILINRQTPVPFVWSVCQQLVPLFYFEGESDYIDSRSIDLKDKWQIGYFKFCFKAQKIRKQFYNDDTLKVVDINDIKTLFPTDSTFELYWPESINQDLLSEEARIALRKTNTKFSKNISTRPAAKHKAKEANIGEDITIQSLLATSKGKRGCSQEHPSQPSQAKQRKIVPDVTDHSAAARFNEISEVTRRNPLQSTTNTKPKQANIVKAVTIYPPLVTSNVVTELQPTYPYPPQSNAQVQQPKIIQNITINSLLTAPPTEQQANPSEKHQEFGVEKIHNLRVSNDLSITCGQPEESDKVRDTSELQKYATITPIYPQIVPQKDRNNQPKILENVALNLKPSLTTRVEQFYNKVASKKLHQLASSNNIPKTFSNNITFQQNMQCNINVPRRSSQVASSPGIRQPRPFMTEATQVVENNLQYNNVLSTVVTTTIVPQNCSNGNLLQQASVPKGQMFNQNIDIVHQNTMQPSNIVSPVQNVNISNGVYNKSADYQRTQRNPILFKEPPVLHQSVSILSESNYPQCSYGTSYQGTAYGPFSEQSYQTNMKQLAAEQSLSRKQNIKESQFLEEQRYEIFQQQLNRDAGGYF